MFLAYISCKLVSCYLTGICLPVCLSVNSTHFCRTCGSISIKLDSKQNIVRLKGNKNYLNEGQHPFKGKSTINPRAPPREHLLLIGTDFWMCCNIHSHKVSSAFTRFLNTYTCIGTLLCKHPDIVFIL